MPPPPASGIYVGAITFGYGPAAPGIGPYCPLAAAHSTATPAVASMKVLIRMEVSSRAAYAPLTYSPTHHAGWPMLLATWALPEALIARLRGPGTQCPQERIDRYRPQIAIFWNNPQTFCR